MDPPPASPAVDLLLLSLGTTRGLRIADRQLAEMARAAGASTALVATRLGATNRLRRGYPVNDLVEATAARRALAAALRRHRPRAIVLSSTTAALLTGPLPVPYAVWLDSPARLNRPGARNAILHLLERRSLARARLVLTLSPQAAAALPAGAAPSVVIAPPLPPLPPLPVLPGLAAAVPVAREPLVVAYAPDPKAKDLALVCAAWSAAAAAGALDGARLIVTGIAPERALAFLARQSVALPAGVELAGMLDAAAFGALLARARVFLSAARWEDFGQTPLQALDRGAAFVAAPAGGPFPALAIARELAPEFVSPDRDPASLAAALGAALGAGEPRLAAYRAAARERLAPYRPDEQIRRLRDDVLPELFRP
jgi:hypothetical protein